MLQGDRGLIGVPGLDGPYGYDGYPGRPGIVGDQGERGPKVRKIGPSRTLLLTILQSYIKILGEGLKIVFACPAHQNVEETNLI